MARMGEIIDGKYEVLREVGRGGMSVVYLAMDKRLNKQWAIKEFRKDKDDVSKQVALKALLDEANLMKKLDHPTLPRIVDIIDNNQNVYVIMDYIEGESLNKVLDAYGAQPQEAVIEWAKQLSDVLDYLHTQNPPVIYRDMKPANIMLKPDGTVRLIDFGIAREYKEGKEGDTEAIGTRGYAAPEQFGGRGQTDARTDIYSLGVTLYHLVTGKNPAEPPYEIYPIRHWDPTFSSGLEWLIQKCTQLNPGDRYQSCAEVTYVLDNLDKFDIEYKKKKKSRFRTFLTCAILTLVFTLVSIGAFVGGSTAKQNSYDNLIKEESFISAIEVDKENPEAYVGLANQLHDVVVTVTAGESSEVKKPGSTVTMGELMKWFPSDIMTTFKSEYPEEYAEIQYRLGYLIWTKYEAEDRLVLDETMTYFAEVLEIAMEGSVDEYAGLSETNFNMVKAYYSVSYFQINRETLTGDDQAGDSGKKLGELQKFAGIDVDVYEDSPFLAFWNTNKIVLEFLKDDNNKMGKMAKLNTLKRLSYLVGEDDNVAQFCDVVDVDEAQAFFNDFGEVLNSISDTDENYAQMKADIKKSINTVLYKYQDKYDNFEMEGIE